MRFSSELPCTTHIPREEVAQSIADMESPVGKLSLICRKYGATLAALKLKAYRSATSNGLQIKQSRDMQVASAE